MGIIGAAFGLGFVLGPAMGGFLSHISLSAPGLRRRRPRRGERRRRLLHPARAGAPRRPRGPAPRFGALLEEIGRARDPAADRASTSSPCSRSARWRRPSRCSPRTATSSAEAPSSWVFASSAWWSHRAGRAHRPAHPPLRREAAAGRGARAAGAGLVVLPFGAGFVWVLVATAPLALGSGLSQPALSSLLSRFARARGPGRHARDRPVGRRARAHRRARSPRPDVYEQGLVRVPVRRGRGVMMATAAVGHAAARPRARRADAAGGERCPTCAGIPSSAAG